MFLLDTNIVSYLIKNTPTVADQLLSKLESIAPQEVFVSSLSEYEIYAGLAGIDKTHLDRAHYAKRLTQAADEIFGYFTLLDLRAPHDTKLAAEISGKMKLAGTRATPIDTLIAAQAIQHQLTLISNDDDFLPMQQHLPRGLNLRIENWCH